MLRTGFGFQGILRESVPTSLILHPRRKFQDIPWISKWRFCWTNFWFGWYVPQDPSGAGHTSQVLHGVTWSIIFSLNFAVSALISVPWPINWWFFWSYPCLIQGFTNTQMAESSMDAPWESGKKVLEWMLDFDDVTMGLPKNTLLRKTVLRMAPGPKVSQNGPEIQTRSEPGPGRYRVV